MRIELRPLTVADAQAHNAGEDDLTVRWLTGGYGTLEGTVRYIEWLAANAAASSGKQGFGVWLDDRLAGYVDYDADPDADPDGGTDGRVPDAGGVGRAGDVSLAYAVHPWARGRGVACAAVRAVCDLVRARGAGVRAVIRVEPDNAASVGVARSCGFAYVGDVRHDGVTMQVHVLDL